MVSGVQKFRCACAFTHNLYLEKYGIHFFYLNPQQFNTHYSQELRSRGFSSDEIATIPAQLEKLVEKRKEEDGISLTRSKKFTQLYRPLDADVFKFNESFLTEEFRSLVNSCRSGHSDHLNRVSPISDPPIIAFKVFTEEFIDRFLTELDNISDKFGSDLSNPNSMNHSGVIMGEIGMDDFLRVLREEYLQPIINLVFPEMGVCDSHRAFTIQYGEQQDKQLGYHYDNAEVTLNVCLRAEDCDGSELVFGQIATQDGIPPIEDESVRVSHRRGLAYLHCGRQMHHVTRIAAGRRTNLILWMRSSAVRNAVCPMCWEEPELVPMTFIDNGFRRQPTTGSYCTSS